MDSYSLCLKITATPHQILPAHLQNIASEYYGKVETLEPYAKDPDYYVMKLVFPNTIHAREFGAIISVYLSENKKTKPKRKKKTK